jgi:hypothetical protein
MSRLPLFLIILGLACAPPQGDNDGGSDGADGGGDASADTGDDGGADAGDDAGDGGADVCVFDAGTPLPVESGNGRIGSPCDGTHACIEGQCEAANFPGGYCLQSPCSQQAPCPQGATCVGTCLKSCTTNADCGRGDYVCWDELVGGAGGVCTFDCRIAPTVACPPPGFTGLEALTECDCETGTCTLPRVRDFGQTCSEAVGGCKKPYECLPLQGGTAGVGFCTLFGCNIVTAPCPATPAGARCITLAGSSDTACFFRCNTGDPPCPDGLTCTPQGNINLCVP